MRVAEERAGAAVDVARAAEERARGAQQHAEGMSAAAEAANDVLTRLARSRETANTQSRAREEELARLRAELDSERSDPRARARAPRGGARGALAPGGRARAARCRAGDRPAAAGCDAGRSRARRRGRDGHARAATRIRWHPRPRRAIAARVRAPALVLAPKSRGLLGKLSGRRAPLTPCSSHRQARRAESAQPDRETVIKFVISGPFLNAEAAHTQWAAEPPPQASLIQDLVRRIADLERKLDEERALVEILSRQLPAAAAPVPAPVAPVPADVTPAPDLAAPPPVHPPRVHPPPVAHPLLAESRPNPRPKPSPRRGRARGRPRTQDDRGAPARRRRCQPWRRRLHPKFAVCAA